MATQDIYIKYDDAFYKEFFPKLNLNFTPHQMEAVEIMVKLGIVQRDRVVELAIAETSGIEIDSVVGADFDNGKEAKSVVMQMRNNDKKTQQWTSSMPVRNITTKTGDLIIVGLNKILDKFHYFYVPRDDYKHLKSQLEIIFERYKGNHEPNWTGIANVNCKWFNYEVDSFETLCKKAA